MRCLGLIVMSTLLLGAGFGAGPARAQRFVGPRPPAVAHDGKAFAIYQNENRKRAHRSGTNRDRTVRSRIFMRNR